MIRLKLTAVDDLVGVVFTREVLARLKLDKGDTVFLTQVPNGYRFTPYDATFESQMTVGRELMKKRRAALRELAMSATRSISVPRSAQLPGDVYEHEWVGVAEVSPREALVRGGCSGT